MLQLTYGIWQFKVHKTHEKSSRQSGRPQIIHRNFVSFDGKRQFPAVTCHTMFPNHYPTFNPTTLFHLTSSFYALSPYRCNKLKNTYGNPQHNFIRPPCFLNDLYQYLDQSEFGISSSSSFKKHGGHKKYVGELRLTTSSVI